MPNRILKESILDSPTLARLNDFTQDQFPRLLLLADDWGCFNADPDAIKGRAYPKRPKVTPKVITETLMDFHKHGMLFLWTEGDRVYGYWTGWDSHNYCNRNAVTEDGKQDRHRRKTPEPPQVLLNDYLVASKNKLEHLGTKGSIPIPIPIPIPVVTNVTTEEEAGAVAAESSVPVLTPEVLMDTYNRERGEMLHCRKLTVERRAHCLSRIQSRRKDPEAYLAEFREAVIRARASPFMTGGGNRKWIADFDFFVKNDTNVTKVLEGKYDAGPQSKTKRISEESNRAVQDYLGDMDAGLQGDFQTAGRGSLDQGENRVLRIASGRHPSGDS